MLIIPKTEECYKNKKNYKDKEIIRSGDIETEKNNYCFKVPIC